MPDIDDEPDDLSEAEIESALLEHRGWVQQYLKAQRVVHGAIGEVPAWHLAPIVSIWAIESLKQRGAVGFWVIAGDLPTDYLSSNDARDPRSALRAFAQRWLVASDEMARGDEPSGVRIGPPEEAAELAPMLRSRAETFVEWADDDGCWADDEGDRGTPTTGTPH